MQLQFSLRKTTCSAVSIFLFLTTLVVSENAVEHETNQIQGSTETVPLNNQLDWMLVHEVFSNKPQNTIFSPFSVKLLLTLLHEASGLNSTTRTELAKALAGTSIEKSRQVYQDFLESSTKENGNYEFNIGTRVFVDQKRAKVTESYLKLVEKCYKTSVEPVVFKEAKATAEKVNNWCSKITQGHLRNLVHEDHVKDAAMIIANVLFLKASWRNSFPEEQSRKRLFHVSATQTVDTDFMEQTDIYAYMNDPELQLEMLRLPYKGRHFSMIIVLPYESKSLDDAIKSLTAESVSKLRSNFSREEVEVIIPKFKFNYGTALNDVLIKIGITDIFTEDASLPQLSGGTNSTLLVSKILQKAGIEVNEKGTLAFAATEIQLVNKFGLGDSPIKFAATRPFLFYIKDEDTDALLFVGKVMNPADSATGYDQTAGLSHTSAFAFHSPIADVCRSSFCFELSISQHRRNSVTSRREFQTFSMTRRDKMLVVVMLLISVVGHSAEGQTDQRESSVQNRNSNDERPPQPSQNDKFDWQLIKLVLSREHGNAALSTLTTKYLLNLLYEGSGTASKTQAELAVPLERSPGTLNAPPFVSAVQSLQSNSKQLLVRNQLFADEHISVTQKYAATLGMTYKTNVEKVDFQKPQLAAKQINAWISEGTQGQIRQLVSAKNLQDSVLMLANTVHFKGLWKKLFSESATSVKPFNTTDGRSVNVTLMKQIQDHYFVKSAQLNAKVLRLPYADGQFSMILILPNKDSNLNQLMSVISADAIHKAIYDMEETELKVVLPRFHIDYFSSVKDALQELGIVRIFQDNAELGGIARGGTQPVKVSDIFQKTVIEVDEKGTVASSGGGSTLVFTIASEPEKFIANRPFMFLIQEESTGTLLFAGKVEDPSQ
ncbi:uncharacterized protein LOC129766838 [Toxorhynchites rutilus septentrionalis]|uniref:uncharacterized protein LOC129766838 n=1 Tax=Toxorhynchites rutilus septentrionalis TaxID=329112 RepID=UPI0024785C11|nr:uncharacterized protein LOC129766838 [Toxorhynchites rutilus septentrionalis]